MKDIAQRAELSVSTVSDVLRNRVAKVKVSDRTRERVLSLAKEIGYEPNAAAHALATGKTYNIGFLLSSKTTLGLANYYFGSYLSGVGDACKERGYNCLVSAYDLSSIEDLIVPAKLRKKNVDGIIITGYVEDEVVNVLSQYDVPVVMVGESVDRPRNNLLTVTRDIVEEWSRIFNYLHQTGCTRIGVAEVEAKRVQKSLQTAIGNFRNQHGDAVEFTVYKASYDVNQFDHAEQVAVEWLAQTPSTRPDGIVSHDQWCAGFLSAIVRAGIAIPDEASVVSTCDTVHCQYGNPRISALSVPLFDHAKDIAHLLVDYIEGKIGFNEAGKRASQLQVAGELVVRETSKTVINAVQTS